MTTEQAQALFDQSRVAVLATVDPNLRPHLVPIVFVRVADRLYSAIDAKPKSSTALRRLSNIAANPHVSVLVERYEEDWSKLAWARADGAASLIERDDKAAIAPIEALCARYPQYEKVAITGPVIAVEVERFTYWQA